MMIENNYTKKPQTYQQRPITQGTRSHQQNVCRSKAILVGTNHKGYPAEVRRCIPCKMAGMNIKAQLPMNEFNCLPPEEKTTQQIQLDFIGPIRLKHRRFFILKSIDRYSRWPAACICETPNEKTA